MRHARLYTLEECGSDGYPPEWHEHVKDWVRERAGHRCVRCGHPYAKGAGQWSPCDTKCTHRGPYRVSYRGSVDPDRTFEVGPEGAIAAQVFVAPPEPVLVEARWRILTVHHLDGNKGNCRWWNLAALCQRCHLQIQGKVKMERVYPWEHSEWFRPYVAGYYAWTYLGEDLTREQVETRLDELLGLERAA